MGSVYKLEESSKFKSYYISLYHCQSLVGTEYLVPVQNLLLNFIRSYQTNLVSTDPNYNNQSDLMKLLTIIVSILSDHCRLLVSLHLVE